MLKDKDTLRMILNSMDKVKTMRELRKILQKGLETIPPQTQTIVDLLHTAFCNKRNCTYISETNLVDTWEQPHHLEWIKKSEEYIKIADINPDEVNHMVTKTLEAIRSFDTLNPKIQKLLSIYSTEKFKENEE